MTTAAPPVAPSVSPGYWGRPRCLHIIDLESLAGAHHAPASPAGGPRGRPDRLLRVAWAAYQQAIGIQRGDHAVVGLRSRQCGRLSDLFAGGGAQLRVSADPAGVRAALAEYVDTAHDARRFDWLVIAGGHPDFATVAGRARASGMQVWLVGHGAQLPPPLAAAHACGPSPQLLPAAA
jgi:hypothetical protein